MEAHRSENCPLALYLSRVKNFHDEGRYWDVQLQIDEEVFTCQRSFLAGVSEYFDVIFSSSLKESSSGKNEIILLHEIDATAFKEIIRFIYTGDVRVTDTNVSQLLALCDFLRLSVPYVEEKCVEYIQKRCLEDHPLPDAVDLFSFAWIKEKKSLVDPLNGHLCQHFRHFSKDARLTDIPFECLKAVLDYSEKYLTPVPGAQVARLRTILNWVNRSRAKRSEYRDDLLENVDFANISPEMASVLTRRMETFVDELIGHHKSIEIPNVPDLNDGRARSEATIELTAEKLSEVNVGETYYSTYCAISDLSWRMRIDLYFQNLMFYVECSGPTRAHEEGRKPPAWSCYANAVLTVKSQTSKAKDLVVEAADNYKFSSDHPRLSFLQFFDEKYSKSDDLVGLLLDEGYIKDDCLIVDVRICADLPFVETRPIKVKEVENLIL